MSPYFKKIINEEIGQICARMLEIKYPNWKQVQVTEALLMHRRDMCAKNNSLTWPIAVQELDEYREKHRIFVGDRIEEPRNP